MVLSSPFPCISALLTQSLLQITINYNLYIPQHLPLLKHPTLISPVRQSILLSSFKILWCHPFLTHIIIRPLFFFRQDPPMSLPWILNESTMMMGVDVSHPDLGQQGDSMAAVVRWCRCYCYFDRNNYCSGYFFRVMTAHKTQTVAPPTSLHPYLITTDSSLLPSSPFLFLPPLLLLLHPLLLLPSLPSSTSILLGWITGR